MVVAPERAHRVATCGSQEWPTREELRAKRRIVRECATQREYFIERTPYVTDGRDADVEVCGELACGLVGAMHEEVRVAVDEARQQR